MTDAITIALDAAFADPNTAFDATYTPSGGSGAACRAVFRHPDEAFSPYAGGGVALPARIAEVRVSEVAAAAEGDTIAVDLDRDGTAETTFPVLAVTRPDPRRLKWRLMLGDPTS